MPPTTPNPRTWTIRFKNNRTTVLLHIDPLQTLSSVKSELLRAIQQTNPTGQFNNHDLPRNADEILLARPADINDLSMGWENLEPQTSSLANDTEFEPMEKGSKGKGKASTTPKSVGKAGANKLKDCPQGAGLRDGGVVAFKFRRDEDEEAKKEDEMDGDEGIVVDDERKEEWGVVVPSMEETYGESQQVGEGQDVEMR